MTIEKIDLKNEIEIAAKSYKDNLLEKNYLIIYGNKYIELQFLKRNFLHLTGVLTQIPANQFFNLAVKNRLTINNFYFSRRYPRDLAENKIINLENLKNLPKQALIILEGLNTQTKQYKIAVTELNYTLCLEQMQNRNNGYFVCSHRIEKTISNIIDKSNNAYFVDFILEKPKTAQKYDKITYQDQTKQLPQTIHHLIADNLKQ